MKRRLATSHLQNSCGEKIMKKKRNFGDSFRDALAGIFHCLMNERNMRTHFIAGIFVFIASIYFRLSGIEIAIIGLTVGLVITTELINTAVENTVDLVTMEYKPLAKIAKDVAAGAVLLASFTAVLVGVALFLPKMMG